MLVSSAIALLPNSAPLIDSSAKAPWGKRWHVESFDPVFKSKTWSNVSPRSLESLSRASSLQVQVVVECQKGYSLTDDLTT